MYVVETSTKVLTETQYILYNINDIFYIYLYTYDGVTEVEDNVLVVYFLVNEYLTKENDCGSKLSKCVM